MKFSLRLVWKNVTRHPLRSLLTAASLAVAIFLLCLLRSLLVTLEAGVRDAASDRLIVQSAVSLFVDLPESYREKIAAVPGVDGVCGWSWFGGYYQKPENFFAQFAVDPHTLLRLYPEIHLVAGSEEAFLADRRACLVGEQIAAEFGFSVGGVVPIVGNLFTRTDGGTWDFQVAGVYRSSSSNVDNRTLFFHYDFLDESRESGAAEGPDGIGVFVVRVAEDAPATEVASRIDALFANGPQRVQTSSEAVFQSQFVSMAGNLPLLIGSIGGGVFLAILLAVVNTMLMAAREQARDAGILKALGFGNGSILLTFLTQGLLLTAIAGLLGVGTARAAAGPLANALGTMFPGYTITVETQLLGFAVAVLVGLIATVGPSISLARRSCIAALRGEA